MKNLRQSCTTVVSVISLAAVSVACSSSRAKPAPKAPAAASADKPKPGPPAVATSADKPKPAPAPVVDKKKPLAEQLAKMDAYTIQCNGKTVDLGELLPGLAKKISGVPYVYGDTDCSGMYHQLHVQLDKKCKEYEAPARVGSRSVARRFYDDGELIQIKDALGSADLIKPGAVIFYGYRQNDYTDIKTDDLFVRGKGIVHIGVVVAVEKKDGKVVNYHLYHGRSKNKPSGVTKWHVGRNRMRTGKLHPAFGNGRQPWIAFARMVK